MIEFLVYIFLPLSLMVNIFLVYYSILAAKKLVIASSNFEALEDVLVSFESHVKTVHESEMFYGDATLQSLIEHSELILEQLDRHKNLDTLVFYEEEELNFEDEEEAPKN